MFFACYIYNFKAEPQSWHAGYKNDFQYSVCERESACGWREIRLFPSKKSEKVLQFQILKLVTRNLVTRCTCQASSEGVWCVDEGVWCVDKGLLHFLIS